MDAKRWRQIDQLLDAALEVSAPLRVNFVTQHAGDDKDLRKQVLDLLRAQDDAGHFLDDSAMHVAAKALADDDTEISSFAFINKSIATYRIERLLGAGGMGEVYLAYDEKLHRKVALKILPSEFLTNDERVKRFELEAKAIAKLNHPGIVTIYDVGNFEGVNYIATEFVEGKTLRDLMGGNFKIRNIVLNSIQICDALAAAHAEGIIHRDIKPENVMIRKDGYAKILDFGLAKLTGPSQHRATDLAATTKGVIIGTPAYMSPSQVADEKIDHRTDLWSCGVVLYEFLTGKNPFKGTSRQETFQAILSKDPEPCRKLNPELPEELENILIKLMNKDRSKSYQSAAELRADLKRVQREVDTSPSWSGTSGRSTPWAGTVDRAKPVLAAVAAMVLVAAIVAAGYWYLYIRKDPAAVDWSEAQSVQLTDHPGTEYFPSISADGKMFVYASDERGQFDIFTQRVGGKARQNITDDSPVDDTQPALSPDGEHIAFRSERTPKGIYIMGASGEEPRLISDVGYHPAWSPDGKEIVVSSFGRDQPTVRAGSIRHSLMIINVATGLRRELTSTEASFPSWSPNGQRIAYWFYTGTYGRRDIATVAASGGEPVVVAKDLAVSNWNPVWSPDGKYLYFVSSKVGTMNFWRVRIDESSGRVLGEPESVPSPSKYSRHLTFSNDGKRMIYVQTNNQANIQGLNFNLAGGTVDGAPFWITQGDREVSRAELSTDGSKFVMRLVGRTQDDIVTVDRRGEEWHEVTNDEPFDRYARWSPDGRQVAFSSDRNGGGQVWVANSDGTGMRQLTFTSDPEMATGFPIWSPDGKRLAAYFNGTTFILDPSKSQNEQQVDSLPKDPRYRLVAWDWSPDGRKLLGVLAEGERRHIGYYSFEDNGYHTVIEDSQEVASWLPDGRRFVVAIKNKIFLGDINSHELIEIFVHPDRVDIRSPFVSRDGKLLYYIAATNESDIWMLDLRN